MFKIRIKIINNTNSFNCQWCQKIGGFGGMFAYTANKIARVGQDGKRSESVQSRAEVYMLKACDACADMGQL